MLHLVLESFSSYLGIYVRDVMIPVGVGASFCVLAASIILNPAE